MKVTPQEFANSNNVFVSKMSNGDWIESNIEPIRTEIGIGSTDWIYKDQEVRIITPLLEISKELENSKFSKCLFLPGNKRETND